MEQQTKHKPTCKHCGRSYVDHHSAVGDNCLNEDRSAYLDTVFELNLSTTAAERDSLKENLQSEKRSSDLLRKIIDNKIKEISDLASEGIKITEERDKLKEEVEELNKILHNRIQFNKELHDRNREVQSELSKLKEEKDQLNKIIDGYQISISQFNALRDINKSLVEALKDCIKSDQVEGFIIDEVRLRSIDLINQAKALNP